MAIIGYHASHEQFAPSSLLRLSKLAQDHGFQAVNCSDHFHPWSARQGHSGFSFAWLGAALHALSIPCGVVCAPGQRYHPAIVAQGIATLGEMFPERFWISLGSGEAINESITGDKWPVKADRNARLLECVAVIRKLLTGEKVTWSGDHITVENARLYTLPAVTPKIFGAAVTTDTAGWVGGWADGLITISKPLPELKDTVKAFRRGGGEGKPVYIKVQLSYAATDEQALKGAHEQWRNNIFSGTVLGELSTVEQFDALGQMVQPDELRKMVNISADPDFHVSRLKEYLSLGVDGLFLHNVNTEQESFIRMFRDKILPKL
jgi:coenzyme F420-dependent glucose-6-phosphate dehydrogenase